jgi:uncharacterized protein (DUF58 family)
MRMSPRGNDEPGLVRDTARGFAEELVLGLVRAALVVVPCVIGYVAGGWLGLAIGLGVGLLLLGGFWVVVGVVGIKAGRRAWREARADDAQH